MFSLIEELMREKSHMFSLSLIHSGMLARHPTVCLIRRGEPLNPNAQDLSAQIVFPSPKKKIGTSIKKGLNWASVVREKNG